AAGLPSRAPCDFPTTASDCLQQQCIATSSCRDLNKTLRLRAWPQDSAGAKRYECLCGARRIGRDDACTCRIDAVSARFERESSTAAARAGWDLLPPPGTR